MVDAETTAVRKVWKNPDGTTTVEVSEAPRRFVDGATWRDINLTVVADPAGDLRATAAPRSARLSSRPGDIVTVDTAAGPLVLRHPDATPVPGSHHGRVLAVQEPSLNPLHEEILSLLGVPTSPYGKA